ncbi:hypothetical protein [Millisia brevis]|uniref:hypothetical protein n=1 Tax=Millisia brevis TaxID=264148 RepID=UPI0012ECEAF2|nr:hypothetical protein [Millisia brevis]
MLLGTLLASGCSAEIPVPTPTEAPDYQPPQNVRNATLVWSAQPEIDLLGPEATLTRATREAHLVALYAGPDNAYPGYMEALRPEDRYFYPNDSGLAPLYGTEHSRIQELSTNPDGFSASICVQPDGLARYTENTYFSSTGPAFLVTYEFVDRRVNEPHQDTDSSTSESIGSTTQPNDSGEADEPTWSAPQGNVFVGWQLTFGSLTEDVDGSCEAWGRTIFPNAPSEPGTVESNTPPPTLPAYPGWARQA